MKDLFASTKARFVSILPMHISDESGAVIEDVVCTSISGGRDYVNGMARRLTLVRFDKDGNEVLRAEYVQVKS